MDLSLSDDPVGLTERQADGGSALSALVRAVETRADDESVHRLIEACVAAGELRDEQGTLVPLGDGPYRIKRPDLSASQLRQLDVLVGRIRGLDLPVVPHWVAGGRVLTLQRHKAIDLREVAGRSTALARWVQEQCLESLAEFSEQDALLRTALTEAGCAPLLGFPVGDRHLVAVAKLERLLRTDVEVPAPMPGGRATLFCDPKPANFLVTGVRDERPERIDLDLMTYTCPVSLQVILALFSHPVQLPGTGSLDNRFAAAREEAAARSLDLGALPGESDTMLVYHLIRNFTSSYAVHGIEARTKARALAPLLACALEQIPVTAAAEPARRIRRLIEQERQE
ncbi:hypothetical protein AV521_08005 [Streptomyces sp. IMTB 2501]|uniref:hypothetical protein n=1 Tax=Streptomyces sp. IMTB 2501 TaxID=1776340 RepID=UPI00096BF8AF|nr:hypothetical protein [Streptomyces sp. IMTB 2501]OLZ72892.1 hypothetical protein AV521_08005 [Streptomyces sp. IMTB 2501]